MGHDKSDISDEDRKNTYRKVFERFAFGKPSLSLPRLILIGAQPGAGKSRVAEKARKELKALGAPVMADIDEIRPLYPKVEAVFQAAPFKMSALINKDCWGWTIQLLLDARHAKNNVVYQATIRHANRIEDLIKDFQKEGFAVDLYVVAANAKHSVHGIFSRFEYAVEEFGLGYPVIPRWVPIPFHNQVYRAFPRNLDYLGEKARLERVGVFSRDGADIYFSEDQLIHRGAGEALIKEQSRSWSLDERTDFCKGWVDLLGKIKSRPDGVLKPKWYVRTAELYATEAEFYAKAQTICAEPSPSGLFVVCRTPNHHFVKNTDGLLVSYARTRESKAPSHPISTAPVSPKPEP